ncbi:MAG: hypothetical protein OXF98_01835 [Rhodospirillaceae bacterium]|nr:hypothetical protein [Rhodospirillaceae bacterium]
MDQGYVDWLKEQIANPIGNEKWAQEELDRYLDEQKGVSAEEQRQAAEQALRELEAATSIVFGTVERHGDRIEVHFGVVPHENKAKICKRLAIYSPELKPWPRELFPGEGRTGGFNDVITLPSDVDGTANFQAPPAGVTAFTVNVRAEDRSSELEMWGTVIEAEKLFSVPGTSGAASSVAAAIARLDRDNPGHWTRRGKPSCRALRGLLGRRVSARERDEAWAKIES